MRILFLLFFSAIINFSVLAQLSADETRYYSSLEDSLKYISQRVFYSKSEANRFEANKQFLSMWNLILKDEKSMQYPFDSLRKDVSILMAPDKKFRIITWDMRKDDQTYFYFGFIQVNQLKKGKKKKEKVEEDNNNYQVFQLIDKSNTVKNPENYIADPSKWFGMLYVDAIKSDDDFYTLIGWDGNSQLIQRKFIDILTFKSDGTPIFGKDVFKFPGKLGKRVMFEYATEVAMSLKYNPSRKEIVFSHLAPNTPDPILAGQFQYYGPDGSYDALFMKNGVWNYKPAIDIKKEKSKTDNVKAPDINKQTPIYKPK